MEEIDGMHRVHAILISSKSWDWKVALSSAISAHMEWRMRSTGCLRQQSCFPIAGKMLPDLVTEILHCAPGEATAYQEDDVLMLRLEV